MIYWLHIELIIQFRSLSMVVKIGVMLSLLCLSACARVVSHNIYPVVVESSPSGVPFIIKNQAGIQVESGITPQQVTLKANVGYFEAETYAVIFNKKGYQPGPFILDTSLDGWYFGNLLFGGFIGMLIVDPLTGAMWELPEKFSVEFKKGDATNQSK